MSQKLCSIFGCKRKVSARGLCRPHNDRFLKYGNAEAGPPIRNRRVEKGINSFFDAFRFFMPEDPPSKGEPWLWRGPQMETGYGFLSYKGNRQLAHRVSYQLFNGEIPEGLHVLHLFDDLLLDVNPHHLRAGTPLNNAEDRTERDRNARGSQLPHAKLTEESVAQARKLHRAGEDVYKLAVQFNVSPITMGYALSGLTWRHVKP